MQDIRGNTITEMAVPASIDGRPERLIPLLVPGLAPDEIEILQAGAPPTPQIVGKAFEHARKQLAMGQSPFKEDQPIQQPQQQLTQTQQPIQQPVQQLPQVNPYQFLGPLVSGTGQMPNLQGLSLDELNQIAQRRNQSFGNRLAIADMIRQTDLQQGRQAVAQQQAIQDMQIAAAKLNQKAKADQQNFQLRERENTIREYGQQIQERKLNLAQQIEESEVLARRARQMRDESAAIKSDESAYRLKRINSIMDKYLEGGFEKGSTGEKIALEALGLSQKETGGITPSQERLRMNDLTNSELAILSTESPEEFNIYNGRYLNDAPDSATTVYVYDPSTFGFGGGPKAITIPKGKTLGDVREAAEARGITVQQVIEMFK